MNTSIHRAHSTGIRIATSFSWRYSLHLALYLAFVAHGFAGTLLQELKRQAPALKEIVFAVRKPSHDGHWYANFGYYGPDENRPAYRDGGRLCKIDITNGKVTNLIDDPTGGIRDPILNHDASGIVFSWRKGNSKHHHLYACDMQGENIRQLTHGEWDDIEPCILPDDTIIFVSSRCKRWVNCWLTQVASLHRCNLDGSNIRRISANIEHDNTPWPLPDGRVLYQRWEYIDRSQISYHHLWTTNPDGTGQMVFYGNQKPGILMIDAKPIPDEKGSIVTIFSPGHGKREHAGNVAILNPHLGPDDPHACKVITKDATFRDPWALTPTLFLVARGHELLAMDRSGTTETIHTLSNEDRKAGHLIHEPRPVIQQNREKVVTTRTDLTKSTGKLILANIMHGRNMSNVSPGEIRKLMVVESLPKPINFTGGMDPVTYGGSFTLERALGTVPVESDGSAYMELPANRSLFLIALDKDGMAVKRMQSFLSVQPGEVTSCIGCHEQRTYTYLQNAPLQAIRRPASKIQAPIGGSKLLDFPRDIQPILNRACVSCHDYEASSRGGPYAGKLILSGDHGPMFSHSYFSLTTHQLFSDGRNRAKSNLPSRAIGSSASRLFDYVNGRHHGASVTPAERQTLRLWIDTAAAYPGTYAALGTGMIGGYQENKQVHTDNGWQTTKLGAEVMERRCSSCHSSRGTKPALPTSLSDERGMSFWMPKIPHASHNTSRHLIFNLSRPQKSLLLLAPLARNAGGYDSCRNPNSSSAVFTNTNDPDYQTLLNMVRAGHEDLQKITRFDMPNFKPHPAYIREMIRFGVLPKSLSPESKVDPYDTDDRYWRSLWHQPSER